MSAISRKSITTKPATHERWDDLVAVFGRQGAFMGCWCMYWRLKRVDFGKMGVKGRRAALKSLTKRDHPPGILFYDASKEPFGWCSIGPREDYPVLQRSYVLKPVDDAPVWSIVCFYTLEGYREKGTFRRLVPLAVDHARRNGAKHVEAYPTEGRWTGVSAYMGIADVYRSLGFREIARRKANRPVLRLDL